MIEISTDCTAQESCPVRVAADILDGKWTTRIAWELVSGKKRFSELQRALPGISPKILSSRLTMLMGHGLVLKTVYPCVPPKTEYELTELGLNMRQVIEAMAEFGNRVWTAKTAGPAAG